MLNTPKTIAVAAVSLAVLCVPTAVSALEMPAVPVSIIEQEKLTAHSYLVMDADTGAVVLAKDQDAQWVPASLTKLVTAMVVLDTQPKLTKQVAMAKGDEVGGARLATKAGIKYRVGDLLHASLVASANNATNALARSTGLSREEFVSRMNRKALELGATHTVFHEPTGIDEKNTTTASDYAKITKAAFSNPTIAKIAKLQNYTFTAMNSKKYVHRLKSTNKLLSDPELSFVGGKTGYLDESRYNFTADVKDRLGNNFIIVLLGSASSGAQFSETKKLANLGGLLKSFIPSSAAVAGTTTPSVAGVSLMSN